MTAMAMLLITSNLKIEYNKLDEKELTNVDSYLEYRNELFNKRQTNKSKRLKDKMTHAEYRDYIQAINIEIQNHKSINKLEKIELKNVNKNYNILYRLEEKIKKEGIKKQEK